MLIIMQSADNQTIRLVVDTVSDSSEYFDGGAGWSLGRGVRWGGYRFACVYYRNNFGGFDFFL